MSVTADCVPYWCNGREVRHTREVCLRHGQLKIHDRVDGVGIYPLAWSFQFSPQIDLVHRNGVLAGQASGQQLFALTSSLQNRLRLELFYGHKRPLRGWFSKDSCQPVPAPLARFSIRANLPIEAEFGFIL